MKPKQTRAQKPFSVTLDTETVWAGPAPGPSSHRWTRGARPCRDCAHGVIRMHIKGTPSGRSGLVEKILKLHALVKHRVIINCLKMLVCAAELASLYLSSWIGWFREVSFLFGHKHGPLKLYVGKKSYPYQSQKLVLFITEWTSGAAVVIIFSLIFEVLHFCSQVVYVNMTKIEIHQILDSSISPLLSIVGRQSRQKENTLMWHRRSGQMDWPVYYTVSLISPQDWTSLTQTGS